MSEGCGQKIGPFDCCTIVTGEASEFLVELPDEIADFLLLDPPFDVQGWTSSHHGYQFAAGANWSSWARQWVRESYRIAKDGAAVFAVGNYQGFHYLAYELARAGFSHHSDYQVAYKGSRKRPTFNKFHVVTESWFYGTRGDSNRFKQQQATIVPLTGNNTHLSYWLDPDGTVRRWEKSEQLLSYFIDLTTVPGQLVIDPFVGSGTSILAAWQGGCHFLACDINPEQVGRARERVRNTQPPLFVMRPEQQTMEL